MFGRSTVSGRQVLGIDLIFTGVHVDHDIFALQGRLKLLAQ
jgi:hypothetical protein